MNRKIPTVTFTMDSNIRSYTLSIYIYIKHIKYTSVFKYVWFITSSNFGFTLEHCHEFRNCSLTLFYPKCRARAGWCSAEPGLIFRPRYCTSSLNFIVVFLSPSSLIKV